MGHRRLDRREAYYFNDAHRRLALRFSFRRNNIDDTRQAVLSEALARRTAAVATGVIGQSKRGQPLSTNIGCVGVSRLRVRPGLAGFSPFTAFLRACALDGRLAAAAHL